MAQIMFPFTNKMEQLINCSTKSIEISLAAEKKTIVACF